MKAAIYTEYGPPEVLHLQEVEKPTPKQNEVLVKIHATTVTTGDCNVRGFVFVPDGFRLMTRLAFGLRKPRKQILGIEFAGEIESVGSQVNKFKPGEPVFGIDGSGLGAYAEYKCISQDAGLATKPASLTYEQAAALPNGALTALTFLRNIGRVQSGQKILINGASGSVGSAAVQLAKYFGAHVTGVCSTRNLALVKSLGADEVIDYTQVDFTTQGENYDIIFDTVGKAGFSEAKKALKPNGVYLTAAGGLKEFRQMFITGLFGKKKVRAGASSERQEDVVFLKSIAEAGKLNPVIDKQYPLEQIAEAHRYVDTGHKRGNVVITVA